MQSGDANGQGGHGLPALLGAFTIWGLLPLYLRELQAVSPGQIMAHRLVWCCLFVLVWLRLRGELHEVWRALSQPATRWRLSASALLISINWLTYVWAVTSGHVVESSLGYFINPLLNVALGVLVLRERLDRVQWTAVACAAAGVVYLTWLSGAPPWIALVLAASFGTYGLVRKTVAVDAMAGLGSETLLLAPLGIGYLALCEATGQGVLGHAGAWVIALLFASGLVTAVPLWLFSYGARRVPYSTVGIVQYVGPSLQLLLGVFVFHEPFALPTALGFGLIWAGLALYAADGLMWRRAKLAE
jgi:chloramphenicol-sensitive protein RarD